MKWAAGTSFDIINSAGNSAIAYINLGTLSLSNSESSSQGFYFKTNAEVVGTSFKTSGNLTFVPVISVSNNSNVDYRVIESSFDDRSRISVEKGSTLNVYGNLKTDDVRGMRFKVDGTFYSQNASVVYLGGGSKITGTFSANQITFKGDSELCGDGVINAAGSVYVDNSSLVISDNATVKLANVAGDSRTSQIVIEKTGELTISAKNAVSLESGLADILVSQSRNGASLTISADNMFGNLVFSREIYNEHLKLTVTDGAKVYFNAISFLYSTKTAKLTINNFYEGSIFFKDISGWDNLDTVTLADADGNSYTKEELNWVAGKYNGIDGYWLSTVPEPATYATVFGALALALAIYRRRR